MDLVTESFSQMLAGPILQVTAILGVLDRRQSISFEQLIVMTYITIHANQHVSFGVCYR